MTILARSLVATTLILGGVVGRVELANGASLTSPVASRWNWTGSCNVVCSDGSCRIEVGSGVVFAPDATAARLQAEAKLRQQSTSHGTVVEGSFNISVTVAF
jgi:hypothetical protein